MVLIDREEGKKHNAAAVEPDGANSVSLSGLV